LFKDIPEIRNNHSKDWLLQHTGSFDLLLEFCKKLTYSMWLKNNNKIHT
jgi:hypothetical protein